MQVCVLLGKCLLSVFVNDRDGQTANLMLARTGQYAQLGVPTPKKTAAIAETLHSARFAPYRAYCSGKDHEALKLYAWNLELSSAFHEVLAVTEVVLRNAIDKQLRPWNLTAGGAGYTENWPQGPMAAPLGTLIGRERIQVARDQASWAQERRAKAMGHRRNSVAVDHNDVLTQFTFGTWRDLLPNGKNPDRRRLWEEALIHAFPNVNDPQGALTFQRVKRLHFLRNRVGHMEHLLDTQPSKKHRDAMQLVRSVCVDTHDWLGGISRVPAVIRSCPVSIPGL